MAAVLDYERFSAKAPDVGQRFEQIFSPLCQFVVHGAERPPKKAIKTVLALSRNAPVKLIRRLDRIQEFGNLYGLE
jgi:hypothetical protein